MREFATIQHILSLTRRAVDDYSMIGKGETVAVGVSGGKDSLTLLCTLKTLSRFHPSGFNVKAITLDTGLPDCDLSHIKKLCDEIEVELITEKTDIYKVVFEIRKEKNPCSLCANLRRGALHDVALKNGINKIALGHHKDDAVETFFLNLFNEGRIASFAPVSYLDRRDITLIRPLIYVEENEITNFTNRESITVAARCCPADQKTQREVMKSFVKERAKTDEGFKQKIFGAMERAGINGYKETEKRKRGKSE